MFGQDSNPGAEDGVDTTAVNLPSETSDIKNSNTEDGSTCTPLVPLPTNEQARTIQLVPLKQSGKTVLSSKRRNRQPQNSDQNQASVYDYFKTTITPNLQKPKRARSNISPSTDDEGNDIKRNRAESSDSDSDSDLTDIDEVEVDKLNVSLASCESAQIPNSVEIVRDEEEAESMDDTPAPYTGEIAHSTSMTEPDRIVEDQPPTKDHTTTIPKYLPPQRDQMETEIAKHETHDGLSCEDELDCSIPSAQQYASNTASNELGNYYGYASNESREDDFYTPQERVDDRTQNIYYNAANVEYDFSIFDDNGIESHKEYHNAHYQHTSRLYPENEDSIPTHGHYSQAGTHEQQNSYGQFHDSGLDVLIPGLESPTYIPGGQHYQSAVHQPAESTQQSHIFSPTHTEYRLEHTYYSDQTK